MKFGGSWSVFQPGKSMFCYGKDLGEREAKKKKKKLFGYAHTGFTEKFSEDFIFS